MPADKKLLRLIEQAVRKRDYLLKIPDVVGIGAGFREKGGARTDEPAVLVYVKKGRKRRKPDRLPVHRRVPRTIRLEVRGRTHILPVDIIETGLGEIGGDGGNGGPVQVLAGQSVGHQLSSGNAGTMGWVARRTVGQRQPVICGNYHVFLVAGSPVAGPPTDKQLVRDPADPQLLTHPSRADGGDINADVIGEVIAARRNHRVDVAVAELLPSVSAVPFLELVGPIGPARHFRATELSASAPVGVLTSGRTSGKLEGSVVEYPVRFGFRYPELPNGLLIDDLIATDLPTQGGDSGCLLVDSDLRPLGMLVGSVGWRSFFMHIRNIQREMRLSDL